MTQKKVVILGGGSWGTAISRIVGRNVVANPQMFDESVLMWVFEEIVDGRKLTEIINTEHENVKYMKDIKIPNNVRAVPDIVECVEGADVIISILPHQFVSNTYKQIKGMIKPDAIAISLTKGLSSAPSDGIKLVSSEIKEILGIEVAVLMGANLAVEVAKDNYCEATIGTKHPDTHGKVLKTLFHSPNFRINVVKDLEAVELCGALKNIVACGAGFADGLGYGDNTKAAIIRLGMMEIIKFVEQFYPGAKLSTFFESCGLADLVTTCYGGRNRRVCEAFVKSGKTMEQVEAEMLNGQSAQGPLTAHEVFTLLDKTKSTEKYPLFVAVHRICFQELHADELIECLRQHPEHE